MHLNFFQYFKAFFYSRYLVKTVLTRTLNVLRFLCISLELHRFVFSMYIHMSLWLYSISDHNEDDAYVHVSATHRSRDPIVHLIAKNRKKNQGKKEKKNRKLNLSQYFSENCWSFHRLIIIIIIITIIT